MASKVADITGNETYMVSLHRKRTSMYSAGNSSPYPPTTQKLIGEQQVHDLLPQGEAPGEALAQDDGDLACNATESESGTTDEVKTTVSQATDAAHPRAVADHFCVMNHILEDLKGRLERHTNDLEKTFQIAKVLELACDQRGSHLYALLCDSVAIPNSDSGSIAHNGCLASGVDAIKRDSRVPFSSSSTSGDSCSGPFLLPPASVAQRQKDDPDLRKTIQENSL